MSRLSEQRQWQRLPRSVAGELSPLLLGITDEVVATIHEELPETRRAGAAFETNLRAGVDASYRQLLNEIGHPEARPDRSVYRDGGRGQMRAGRAFDELLAFYRISALVLWRRLSAAARGGDVPLETVALLGEAILAYIHELSGVAARGYMDAQSAAARAQHARRESLVHLLIQADPTRSVVEEAVRAAGWRLPDRLAAVVVSADADDAGLAEIPPDALRAPVDAGVCVLTADTDLGVVRERVKGAAGEGTVAAVGPLVGPLEAALSYERAALALELAQSGAIPADRVVDAGEHAVALVLAGDRRLARELSERRLAPLAGLRPEARVRMIETLDGWLAFPGRPQAIAEQLHLHVQSVRYRLDRLRDLFGDQLDDPEARFELALALRARGPCAIHS